MLSKKLKGFSLPELMIVLVIIGILATLTITTVGTKVDKNKALFKKEYSTIERVVSEIVNDESIYPTQMNSLDFGLNETTNEKILGTEYFTACTVQDDPPRNCGSGESAGRLVKFCNALSNSLSTTNRPKFDGKGNYDKRLTITGEDGNQQIQRTVEIEDSNICTFRTVDGVDWRITKLNNMYTVCNSSTEGDCDLPGNYEKGEDSIHGFLISLDVDGINKGVNEPSLGLGWEEPKISTETLKGLKSDGCGEGFCINTPNRDRYYVYVRYDGKVEIPKTDTIALQHLRSTDMNRQEEVE